MFKRVNFDCDKDEQVPLSDVEFYAEQIDNLTDNENYERAKVIARWLSEQA